MIGALDVRESALAKGRLQVKPNARRAFLTEWVCRIQKVLVGKSISIIDCEPAFYISRKRSIQHDVVYATRKEKKVTN